MVFGMPVTIGAGISTPTTHTAGHGAGSAPGNRKDHEMEQCRSEGGCEQYDGSDTIAYSGNTQMPVCVSDEPRVEQPGQGADDDCSWHRGPPAHDGRQKAQHCDASSGIGSQYGQTDGRQQKDQESRQATNVDGHTVTAGSTTHTSSKHDVWRVPRSHIAASRPKFSVANILLRLSADRNRAAPVYGFLTPSPYFFSKR